MHLWMIPVAAIATVVIVIVADGVGARIVGGLYGLAGIGLYSVSAAAHYKIWEPKVLHRLFQLDHSMIMIFIAFSTLPVGYDIGGGRGLALALGMFLGAFIGLVAIWTPIHPPRGFMNVLFLAVGWWPVLFVTSIGDALGSGGVILLLIGGAVFTIGALIVGFQFPNPNPEVFGYHEIWHIFVIVGTSFHYAVVVAIVTGATPL